MSNIEVELRSFITEKKYQELLKYFQGAGKHLKSLDQETHYFDCKEDLRIQKGDDYSKFWMKGGKIHDEAREETEIFFRKDEFEKLGELFKSLGYKVKIKWFRKRDVFEWQEAKVFLDYTRGYGHIIEIEINTDEDGKDIALEKINKLFAELEIEITPREEFEEKFKYYETNWKKLI